MKRPSLPRPWRWRRGRVDIDAPPRPNGHDEDARLLRNTRLRLMALSGLVTLLILVVLEGATYATVANRVEQAGIDHLKNAAGIPSSPSDDTVGTDMSGPRAGVTIVLVDPTSKVVPYARMPKLLVGLPDRTSLAAVTKTGDLDIRDVTLPSGAQFTVMSYMVSDPNYPNYKVQLVLSRADEVDLLNILGTVLLGGGLLALLAALAAGYLYAGRALVPIRASIDRREAALQRQREFAANASHELRTPLTVIGASVEDLKRNRRSKVQDVGEAVDDIEAEVRHMTALVEDMLLLARTDSGVVQVDLVPLDLGDIAADAASSLAMLGQERGVNVVLDPLPAPVVGDPLRLRQLVTILVDNAIRHSPAGSTVEARVRPAAGSAILQVEDRGPGIKPEDLPRLFERFWRADNAPAGGTGLGLAIAKWIVEQHGGQIGAVNRPDGGASFNVWLPAVPVRNPAWTPESAPDAAAPEPAVPPEAWAAPKPPIAPEPPILPEPLRGDPPPAAPAS
jgi:signal transduction histidine kinase